MKTITRRLHRLEERLGLQPETEFERRVRARTEAAQRRLAETRERGELGPPETVPHTEACRRRLTQAMGCVADSRGRPTSYSHPNRLMSPARQLVGCAP